MISKSTCMVNESQVGYRIGLLNTCSLHLHNLGAQLCSPIFKEKGKGKSSVGQEKYVRELSVTPMGYLTGAIDNRSCGVSHRDYFAWRNGDFPKVSFTLDGT
jgi:hypothetical protein